MPCRFVSCVLVKKVEVPGATRTTRREHVTRHLDLHALRLDDPHKTRADIEE